MATAVPHEAQARVLIVDDEPVVCEVLARLLGGDGLEVEVAATAEQAIERLEARRYALLVSDKNLPKMTGLQLLTVARQRQPFIEALLITAYPSVEALLWAFAAGASDFLVKPFPDLAVVRAKVRAALARYARRARGESQRSVAKEAAELLMSAPDTPAPLLETLQAALQRYELAVATPDGKVAVEGQPTLGDFVKQAGLSLAESAAHADVVLLSAASPDWRERLALLGQGPATVVLLAEGNARLDDLLEAISRDAVVAPLEAGPLLERVRGLLGERGIQRAQAELVEALASVRQASA